MAIEITLDPDVILCVMVVGIGLLFGVAGWITFKAGREEQTRNLTGKGYISLYALGGFICAFAFGLVNVGLGFVGMQILDIHFTDVDMLANNTVWWFK